MRTSVTAYYDGEVGQEPGGELQLDISRRQIGDRMAFDYYVSILDPATMKSIITFPFRQLKHAVDQMIKYKDDPRWQ